MVLIFILIYFERRDTENQQVSLELLPQTSKRYFQNFLLEVNQQFATDNLYLPIPQYL